MSQNMVCLINILCPLEKNEYSGVVGVKCPIKFNKVKLVNILVQVFYIFTDFVITCPTSYCGFANFYLQVYQFFFPSYFDALLLVA